MHALSRVNQQQMLKCKQLLNNTGVVRMVTVGDIAILKRMIFEAQTAVISLVRSQSDPNSDPSARKLPAAETQCKDRGSERTSEGNGFGRTA